MGQGSHVVLVLLRRPKPGAHKVHAVALVDPLPFVVSPMLHGTQGLEGTLRLPARLQYPRGQGRQSGASPWPAWQTRTVQSALLTVPVVLVVQPLVHSLQAGMLRVALPPHECRPCSQGAHTDLPSSLASPYPGEQTLHDAEALPVVVYPVGQREQLGLGPPAAVAFPPTENHP